MSFNASEQLSTISVRLNGPESALLDASNFTETGSGPYNYTATYNGSSDGRYTATLYTASDANDNNGANSESDSVAIGTAVVSSSLEHLSGTKPDMSNVTLDARFSGGLLQVQAKNASANTSDTNTEPDYELAGLGADSSTRIRMNVTVQNFTPRVLIGSAHDANWTRTDNGDNTWNLSIEGTPAAVESYFKPDGSSPMSWPGTYQANESQDAALTFAVDDLSAMSQTHRERLNGSIMTTDAQEFGTPQYNATGSNDKVELTVKAPHFTNDGTNNTGFFEAFLPQTLLTNWGVSASELAGELNGQSRATTITPVSGGVRVDFGIHYSEGTAAITVDTTAPTADAGSDQTVDEGMTVQFDGSNTTDNVGVSTYNWTFGDGSNTTGEKPSHTYGSPGTYTVTLNASDSAGNYDTDTLTVIVEEVSSGSSGSGSSSSSSDEEPEIEETTVTVDQSSEEDEETGTDDAESDSTTESSWSVTVSNARADQSVDISFEEPETDETDATDTDDAATDDTESDETIQPNIRVPRIRMNIATDGDFTLDVTTRERGQPIGTDNGDSETPTGTDAGGSDTLTESSQSQSASSLDGLSEADREFARGTGSRAIGEVTVDHSIPDEDIEDVTFTFRVGKSYLDRSGISAESVGLYRDETVRWNALPTTLVDETDSEYVFEATSPGLSVFTVGSIQPLYEVTDSRVSKTSLATGESVDVTLTVANRGGEAGNYTAALTADGEVVTSETVFIDAQSDTTLTLSPAFDAAGDYHLRVGQQSVGSVAVGGGSDADSGSSDVGRGGSDADSDGNALIVVLLFATLGGTVVALWYRRQ